MAKTRLYSKHGEEGLEWMVVSFQTYPSAFLHSGHQGREQEQCIALQPGLGLVWVRPCRVRASKKGCTLCKHFRTSTSAGCVGTAGV